MHYTQDNGLKNLGDSIIKAHRPKLEGLKICYLFRPQAPVSNGKATTGMCIRLDDRNWTIHKFDFVIEIAKDVWDQASDQFKLALMDHELGHIGLRLTEKGVLERAENGRLKTYCRMHDIEEFDEIMERHGTYHQSLRQFISAYARSKEALKKVRNAEASDRNDDEPA